MAKIGQNRFLPAYTVGNYSNITLWKSLQEKSGKYHDQFWRNVPKRPFLAQNGQIWTKNGPKMAKFGRTRFFPAYTLGNYSNRTLWKSLQEKSGKSHDQFWRNVPKRPFLAQNGQIWTKNGENDENGIFLPKSENVTSVPL